MSELERILRNIPRAVKDPLSAFDLARKRWFPFALRPKHRSAYRIGGWDDGRLAREPVGDVLGRAISQDVTLLRALDREQDISVDLYELGCLCSLVRERAPKRIVEIGTWDGNTTVNLAANAPADAIVTTIDLPPDWNGGGFALDIKAMQENVTDRARVAIQYKGSPYESRIKQVYGDSAKVDYDKLDGPFDLAFIDGCHDYAYVKKDTDNVLAHLARGGVVLWHDYGSSRDVSRAVDEYADSLKIRVIEGTRLAVYFS